MRVPQAECPDDVCMGCAAPRAKELLSVSGGSRGTLVPVATLPAGGLAEDVEQIVHRLDWPRQGWIGPIFVVDVPLAESCRTWLLVRRFGPWPTCRDEDWPLESFDGVVRGSASYPS
jgi:hypothetical protein